MLDERRGVPDREITLLCLSSSPDPVRAASFSELGALRRGMQKTHSGFHIVSLPIVSFCSNTINARQRASSFSREALWTMTLCEAITDTTMSTSIRELPHVILVGHSTSHQALAPARRRLRPFPHRHNGEEVSGQSDLLLRLLICNFQAQDKATDHSGMVHYSCGFDASLPRLVIIPTQQRSLL